MKDEDREVFVEELEGYVVELSHLANEPEWDLRAALRILHAIEGAAGILKCDRLHKQIPLWEKQLAREQAKSLTLGEVIDRLSRFSNGLKSGKPIAEIDAELDG